LFADGLGVDQDAVLAEKYFVLACERGYEKACDAFEALKLREGDPGSP
jgi:TPR repeat protein